MNNSENLYLKIIKWGIFLCVFTPLILHPQLLSIFHFPKVLVFRSIVEIMLVFYILLILGSRNHRPKWNALLIAVTVFTGLYVGSSLFGINPYRSFWGTLERMGGVFNFLHYWVFFVILISVFKSKADWLKLLKLGVVAGFLSILYAYGQYFNIEWFVGWQRTNMIGTAGNAALFAGYLIFILFLSIYFLIKGDANKTKKIEKGFYGLVLILGVPALFLTDVRGSIISFLGALFLLGLYTAFTSKDSKIKKGSIAVIILLIIIVSFFWFSRNQAWVQESSYLRRITDISLKTETVQTRIWAWKSAWQGWKERFVLGWGPENFNVLFATHFDPRHYKGFGSEVVWDRAHNVFLNTGATMGIIGLLSYLSIFIVLAHYFIRAFRKKIAKKLTLGIFGTMLIAYIGHNMFIFDSFNSYLMFFIVLGYLGFLLISPKSPELEVKREDEDKISSRRKTFAIILIPVIIFTIYKTAIIPAKANYASTRAIVYGRSEKHFPTAFDYFRKALSFNAIQAEYEIRHHLARLVFRVFSETDNPQELGVREEDIKFAISEIHKNIETDPLDYIPYLYAARLNVFLFRISEADKAEERLNKAEEFLNTAKSLNEKNPYIYFELGQVRIFQNRLEEAIEFFNQGTLFNPEVKLGYWYMGVTYLDIGEIEKGEENINKAIERGYKKNVSNIRRLLEIYVQLKDYPKIIELYLEALELEPKNAQFYASLSTAYKENKEIDKAIEAARRVGELDPKLKPEADAFIRMLEREYK